MMGRTALKITLAVAMAAGLLLGVYRAAENLQRRKSRHPLPKQEWKKYFV
ncbi:hypothetical protein [Dialister invisus]